MSWVRIEVRTSRGWDPTFAEREEEGELNTWVAIVVKICRIVRVGV